MSEFVEVKTAELTGPALDWAASVAAGLDVSNGSDGSFRVAEEWIICLGGCFGMFFSPSTDWWQGGLLIEKYRVRLQITTSNDWYASTDGYAFGANASGQSRTPLTAACRAIVSAKLGDVVQVPKELIND